jgi:cell division protein FtsL
MWGEIANEADGIRRQQERIALPEFWGKLVDGGAKVCRHDNTVASAKNIIRNLLPLAPVPLQMQVELNTHGQQIYATAAGQQLHNDLNNTSNKVFKELQQLRADMQQQTKENEHLRQEIREMQARFDDIMAQKRILKFEKVSNVSC